MQVFRVDDMSCDHCAGSITKAVRAVDGGARVEVDLSQDLVRIEATEADAAELRQAIAEAGYTPVPVDARDARIAASRAGGCCCGSGSGTSRCGA